MKINLTAAPPSKLETECLVVPVVDTAPDSKNTRADPGAKSDEENAKGVVKTHEKTFTT